MAQTSNLPDIIPIFQLADLPDSTLDLTPFTTAYIDRNKTVNLEEARKLWQQEQFTPLADLEYPSKFESGKYHYWLQFQITNNGADTLDLIFRLSRLDSSFYYQYVDKQLERSVLFGNQLSLEAINQLGMVIPSRSALPVQFLPKTTYQIFVKTKDELYLTDKIRPKLQSPFVFLEKQSLDQFYQILFDGFFLGILFFVSLFSFLQFIQYRDKAFLFYALYIGQLFLLHWVLFDIANYAIKIFHTKIVTINHFKVPFEALLYISYTLFIHYFINENKQFPQLTRLVKVTLAIFSGYFLFTSTISFFFEVKYVWIIHYYFRIGMSVLVVLFLIHLGQINSRLAKYLILGTVSLLFFTLLAPVIFSLTLKNKLFLGKDYTYLLVQVGVLIELLCFSLGLGYKRYLAEQAKITAKEKEKQSIQLVKFKNQFYTNLTHEFRTPLTVVMGMAEDLKRRVKNGELARMDKPIEMIQRNGQNLLNLVNQMLDLAQAESGNLVLDLKKSDVILFIKYICESFQSYAEQKGIILIVYAEIDSLEMDFDADKMSIILSNLLSNAIKYTPNKGKIIVHINQVQEEDRLYLFIKIKDEGIGISATELPAIFNRFYQTTDAILSQKDGIGIGLALTKELVELMEGTITAKSKKGSGSEFFVRILVTQHAPKLASNEILTKLTSFTTAITQDLPAAIPITNNRELPIALIIEDNLDVTHYLISCLVQQYQILHANNGKTGIELAVERIPDIIISDVMMPEKDGFEVCQILKKDERTNHIPIIILTAKATTNDRLEGLSKGADAYIAKPFEKTELLIRLEELMRIRKTLQQKYSLLRPDIKKKVEAQKEDSFIQKIERTIIEHLSDDNFSANDLAHIHHLSRSQIHRKIKALTGMSTAIYIRFVRLKKAKELLTSRELTISEIAYQVGFRSPAYFSQSFKEMYGESPSATRK